LRTPLRHYEKYKFVLLIMLQEGQRALAQECVGWAALAYVQGCHDLTSRCVARVVSQRHAVPEPESVVVLYKDGTLLETALHCA
jgi:hypothetical protein